MNKLQQTFVIGLGEQGIQALEHFKQLIVSHYGDSLPAIKMLGITVKPSDAVSEGEATKNSDILAANELLLLEPIDSSLNQPDTAREVCHWLPESLKTVTTDWNKTRAYHRAVFHTNLSELDTFLRDKLQDMSSIETRNRMLGYGFEVNSDRKNANLIVLSSISDAVGSALITDITYLINTFYEQDGLQSTSTGILFMPPPTENAPVVSARAFITLKEINNYMNSEPYHCTYPNMETTPIERREALFNNGCYLLGLRNEKNIALNNLSEQTQVAGEWLYRILLTPLKERVDEFASGHLATMIRGQVPAFSSFGLSAYIFPANELVDWCTHQLGFELLSKEVLKAREFKDVANELVTFKSDIKYLPDELKDSVVGVDGQGKKIGVRDEWVESIRTAPHNEIVPRTSSLNKRITETYVPDITKTMVNNARLYRQKVGEEIDKQIRKILELQPSGGLSLATQLVERIRDDSDEQAAILKRRAIGYQAQSEQAMQRLQNMRPALERAIASKPATVILLLAGITGLLCPLLLVSFLLWQAVDGAWAGIGILFIWVSAAIGVGYALYQANQAVEKVRRDYAVIMSERAKAEIDQAAYEQVQLVYPQIREQAESRLINLQKLSTTIHQLAIEFRKHANEQKASLGGERGFAMQRSVLTEDVADELFARVPSSKPEVCLGPLLEENGNKLYQWLTQSEADLREMILTFCEKQFTQPNQSLLETNINTLLPKQYDAVIGKNVKIEDADKLKFVVQDLLDRSAPLWSFNRISLGVDNALSDQVFVGLETDTDTVENTALKKEFTKINEKTMFAPIGDRYRLIVTTIRRGMPLFALLRTEELRRSYVAWLKGNEVTVHVDDETALMNDFRALDSGATANAKQDAATVVALGCALGVIKLDPASNQYVAIDKDNRIFGEKQLTNDRLKSAILLGMNDSLWKTLDEMVQQKTQGRATKALAAQLKKYNQTDSPSAWERKRIENYIQLL